MKLINKKFTTSDNSLINYYETENKGSILLMIHAQGANSSSFFKQVQQLSKNFHIILVDCYGHGKSSHNVEKYNLKSQGEDLIEFINTISNSNEKVNILGHSSGALIASYIASKSDKVENLILEDGPFFASVGERRFNTYNYLDLSMVCHFFTNQNEIKDFPYYYFMNQYCWDFFPEKSREDIRNKLGKFALKYREKNPDKTLFVPFWPRKFLEVFNGLNEYDPHFGVSFYDDSFNFGVDYEELLQNINCPTLFMKANTIIAEDGIVQGALTDEDLSKVDSLIKNMDIKYFDCGHGIHNEKSREFVSTVRSFLSKEKTKDEEVELN